MSSLQPYFDRRVAHAVALSVDWMRATDNLLEYIPRPGSSPLHFIPYAGGTYRLLPAWLAEQLGTQQARKAEMK